MSTCRPSLGIANYQLNNLFNILKGDPDLNSPPSLSTIRHRGIRTHGRHQMVNTKIRLIMFFAAKDGEALYSQQKQDWELSVAQITNSLLQTSDLN